MELVSVVIITYKRPLAILKRAIQSVLAQTYQNIELIIVNDAPEESSLHKEIQNYIRLLNNDRINYVLHEHNLGANAARNTGIKYSKGKYLAFLDDDDEWLPEKIEKQITAHVSDKIGIVYCGFYVNTNGVITERKAVFPKKKALPALIEFNFIGSTSFPLLLKSAVERVGCFDVNQKSCQEHELWIRIAKEYEVVGLSDCLGIYYISKDSTFKSNYASYIAGDNGILNKNKDLEKVYPIEFSNHLLGMAWYFASEKQYKLALDYKIKAIKMCWYNVDNCTLIYSVKKMIFKYL